MFITVFLLRIELQVKYSIRLVLHYVLYVHYIFLTICTIVSIIVL
jgi:hypothetical protein